jgi:uncharacterized protein YrzB (UPF0473 family)
MENRFSRNPFRETERDRKKDIYVTSDVFKYLQESGREKLCQDLFRCDKWKVEPALLDDLRKAGDDEERNRLRGLIRAVSNFPPEHPSTEDLVRRMDTETRLHDEEWQEIERFLKTPAVGDDAEEAMRAIEARYNSLMDRWKTHEDSHAKEALHAEIERLRPIRDQLYLRRVHPNFARGLLQKVTLRRNVA